jgi:hypothetical protein
MIEELYWFGEGEERARLGLRLVDSQEEVKLLFPY